MHTSIKRVEVKIWGILKDPPTFCYETLQSLKARDPYLFSKLATNITMAVLATHDSFQKKTLT